MAANISTLDSAPIETFAKFFHLIGQPARIRILLTIGVNEVCVCHIEAALGRRQAGISQHLMVLRNANLVTATRVGRNIYYRLTDVTLLEVFRQIGRYMGLFEETLLAFSRKPVTGCPCPRCSANHALEV